MPEGRDDRLFFDAENRQMSLPPPDHRVFKGTVLSPFCGGLYVDEQLPAQRRIRSFRSLYENSGGVHSRRAPVKNVSHNVFI